MGRLNDFSALLGTFYLSVTDMNSLYDVFGYMSKLHQMILAMLERADHALDALSGVIGISKDCSINSLKHSYHEMKETAPIPSTKSALFSVMPN